MPEIMMTFDVGVPQQGVALFDHDFDREPIQIHRWHQPGLKHGLLDLRMRSISHRLSLSRWRQCDQTISLHPQQRHAATHIFEVAVASAPVQPLTDLPGKPVATGRRIHSDQGTDQLDIRQSERDVRSKSSVSSN